MTVTTGPTPLAFSARSLARSWLASFSGQALQLTMQVASFVLLARFLGAGSFGLKVGLGAVAAMTGPLVGFGFANLLVRNTARQPASFAESWGNALLVTAVGGIVLSLACTPIARLVLPLPVAAPIVVAIFFSDLAIARLVALVGTAFQARGRIADMARAGTALQAARLCAVGFCVAVAPSARLEWWAIASMVASLAALAVILRAARRDLGPFTVSLPRMRREFSDGLPFVLSPYTQVVNNDADKIVLGRFAAPQAVGAYGAAYRALSVASMPLVSLLAVTYPLFFEEGTGGIGASRRFARRISAPALGAGLAATLAVLVGGQVLVRVLGAGYEDTAVILRWLSVLPVLRAVQFLFADALTGAGFQRRRTTIQACVAALNVALNLLLVPSSGWVGAAIAALASDAILALALGLGALGLRSLDRRPSR